MAHHTQKTFTCPLCNIEKNFTHSIHSSLIHPSVSSIAEQQNIDLEKDPHVCMTCVDKLRADYIQKVIDEEASELSEISKQIEETETQTNLMSQDINTKFERSMTFGERLADKIAEFGGSWRFIMIFVSILLGWIILNTWVLTQKPFDPFPYILLNLVLSCLAAIQAPIIMMSQNRQSAKDRLQAEQDFKVNLKAELEIKHLHAKMDMLLTHQWQRLLEIQQMQIEMMENLLERKPKS